MHQRKSPNSLKYYLFAGRQMLARTSQYLNTFNMPLLSSHFVPVSCIYPYIQCSADTDIIIFLTAFIFSDGRCRFSVFFSYSCKHAKKQCFSKKYVTCLHIALSIKKSLNALFYLQKLTLLYQK